MRKLYSIFLLMMTMILGTQVSNAFTVKIDGDPSNVEIKLSGDDNLLDIVNGECEIPNFTPGSAGQSFEIGIAASSSSEITNVLDNNGKKPFNPRTTPDFPTSNSVYIYPEYVDASAEYIVVEIDGGNGGGGDIVPVEPEKKVLTIKGDDKLYTMVGPGTITPNDDGDWVIEDIDIFRSYITVYLKDEYRSDYEITGSMLDGEKYENANTSEYKVSEISAYFDATIARNWAGKTLEVNVAAKQVEEPTPAGFKFVIDGPEGSVVLKYPSEAEEIVGGVCYIELDPSKPYPVMVEPQGTHNITAIVDNNGNVPGSYTFPTNSTQIISVNNIAADAEYITIEVDGQGGTVVEPVAKVLTIKANDKLNPYLGTGESLTVNNDGDWEVAVEGNHMPLTIALKDDYKNDYEIAYVMVDDQKYEGSETPMVFKVNEIIAWFDNSTMYEWGGKTMEVVVVEKQVEVPTPAGFKFVIDGPEGSVVLKYPSEAEEIVDGVCYIELDPSKPYPVMVEPQGTHNITAIVDNNGNVPGSYTFPTNSTQIISVNNIAADAEYITIEVDGQGGPVVEPEKKILTIQGDEKLYAKLGDIILDANSDGNWVIEDIEANHMDITVYLKEEYRNDYKITYAMVDDQKFEGAETPLVFKITDISALFASSTAREWAGKTIIVNIEENNATVEPDPNAKTFTVKVDGDAAKVEMLSSTGKKVVLDQGETEVTFVDEDNDFTIQHVSFGGTLYNAEVDGNGSVEKRGETRWMYTAADGDLLTITVEAPADQKAPVTFNFTNDNTEESVIRVLVNQVDALDWKEGLSVDPGSYVTVMFDKDAYDFQAFTCNAEDEEGVAYAKLLQNGNYDVQVPAEGLVFTITATKKAAVSFTIEVVGDPAGINYSLGFSGIDPVTPEHATTVVNPSSDYTAFAIAPNAGYTIVSIVDELGTEYNWENSIDFRNGAVYTVTVKAKEADGELIVYIQETNWPYLKLGWNMNLGDMIAWELGNSDVIAKGYNKIGYMEGMKFFASGYPVPQVYINNESAVVWDPTHEYTIYDPSEDRMPPLNPGDVIKIYTAAPQVHSVVYEMAQNDLVEVRHDHVRVIDNPANHNEHHGTIVHLTPKAGVENVYVKANDEDVQKDGNGQYVITINDDTTIKVSNVSGIDNVTVDGENANDDVYNLQGIKVNAENLPAGIYIKGGKKIYVK